MKKLYSKIIAEFDERERRVNGNVYRNTFFFALFITFLHFILTWNGIDWVSTNMQFLICGISIFTFYAVEASLRGVSLGKSLRLLQPLLYFAVAVMLLCRTLYDFSRNETLGFINDCECHNCGIITATGAYLIIFLVAVCSFIEYFRGKKAGNDLFEEEGK
jgi:hypothetical protein